MTCRAKTWLGKELILLEENLKAFLAEMVVVGQHLGKPVPPHALHRTTICEAIIDLLRKSARTEQIEIVQGGEQVYAQAEAPATVAITVGQDFEHFEFADDMLT